MKKIALLTSGSLDCKTKIAIQDGHALFSNRHVCLLKQIMQFQLIGPRSLLAMGRTSELYTTGTITWPPSLKPN